MDDSWAAVIENHWPWLIPVIVLGAIALYVVKAFPIMQGIGRSFKLRFFPSNERSRHAVAVRVDDLEKTVLYLQLQIGELRYRDEMTWAWILSDQDWHRKVEFLAVEKGWDLPQHISYMEFREEWIKLHPIPELYKV